MHLTTKQFINESKLQSIQFGFKITGNLILAKNTEPISKPILSLFHNRVLH